MVFSQCCYCCSSLPPPHPYWLSHCPLTQWIICGCYVSVSTPCHHTAAPWHLALASSNHLLGIGSCHSPTCAGILHRRGRWVLNLILDSCTSLRIPAMRRVSIYLPLCGYTLDSRQLAWLVNTNTDELHMMPASLPNSVCLGGQSYFIVPMQEQPSLSHPRVTKRSLLGCQDLSGSTIVQ
jgi:hypothetical protein